jgi:cysteine desulfurase
MLANNETGVIQPLAEASDLLRSRSPDALLHTDAVGAGGWLDLARATACADLVSVAAHKLGGPKGVGALVVRRGARLAPVLHGGPQERERRPGTHDVAGIVGMATAFEAAAASRGGETARVAGLRDRLASGLLEVPGAALTVRLEPPPALLPGTLHMRFDGVHQEELLVLLDQQGICASAGAACASGALELSHVLLAMGLSTTEAASAVRFTLGWSTTGDDVDEALQVVPKAVARLRTGTGTGTGT